MSLDRKAARSVIGDIKLFGARMPKAEEVNLRTFYPADGSEIVELLFGKAEVAVNLYLPLDFLDHLRSEYDPLIAALKRPCGLILRKLVVDCLSH